ncbi:MAG: Holliday junction resolvase RuvX [Nitrospirota bacterium]
MRFLALDVGDRRIGVAVSDELGITAQGVSTIHRRSWASDLAEIARLAEHWDAGAIVVGWPLTLAGTVGPRARIVQDFMTRLQGVVRVPITTWDERFTTATAERVLIDADVSRAKRKQVIDKAAAVVILQDFLDAQTNRTSTSGG